MLNKIVHGDCLEVLKTLEDSSIDSIVTDPPYELGFMGKRWDSTGIAYNVELWKECLRVLKPGGHLLAFGGTRTQHRMVCAIEDAGFEIREQIQWIFGSGFPKSMNIGKAVKAYLKTGGSSPRNLRKSRMGDNYKPTGQVDYRKGRMFSSEIENDTTPEEIDNEWAGWGTCLKPAHEPICLARKPISEKTVAENVLKWGTGAINIDGCRVGTEQMGGYVVKSSLGRRTSEGGEHKDFIATSVTGRFPANVILDEEAGALLDQQSGSISYGNKPGGYSYSDRQYAVQGFIKDCKPKAPSNYGDSGGASRFFYCAKASKKERGEGNNHPTVKPIKLIEYLITLITPPNGTVLDPFLGSGTTAIAALNTGRYFIGIEKEPKYVELARKRVKEHKVQLRLAL